MGSQWLCTACRRASQQRTCQSIQLQTAIERSITRGGYRPFSAIHRHATPVAPKSARHKPSPALSAGRSSTAGTKSPQNSSKSKPKSNTSANPTQSIAKSLRESLPAVTETYVAYGSCEKLVKECARQAEYRMPQATEKGAEVSKTNDGTELGVGDGWWYKSTF